MDFFWPAELPPIGDIVTANLPVHPKFTTTGLYSKLLISPSFPYAFEIQTNERGVVTQEVFDLLWERTSNKKLADSAKLTALHYIAPTCFRKIFSGATLSGKPVQWFSALENILKEGCDPNSQDSRGDTPLHKMFASFPNDGSFYFRYDSSTTTLDAVQCLRASGASLTIKNINGMTPLHLAAQSSSVPAFMLMISMLTQSEQSILNEYDSQHATPLLYCVDNVTKGQTDTEYFFAAIQSLIEKGASANVEDKDGNSPLHLCFSRNDYPTALQILYYSPKETRKTLAERENKFKQKAIETLIFNAVRSKFFYAILGLFSEAGVNLSDYGVTPQIVNLAQTILEELRKETKQAREMDFEHTKTADIFFGQKREVPPKFPKLAEICVNNFQNNQPLFFEKKMNLPFVGMLSDPVYASKIVLEARSGNGAELSSLQSRCRCAFEKVVKVKEHGSSFMHNAIQAQTQRSFRLSANFHQQTFGAPTSSPFGIPTVPPPFGTTSSSSPFGTTAPSSPFGIPPAFGTTSSSSPFGTTAPSSPFGTPTVPPPFGTTSSSSPFGTKASSSSFGTTASSSPIGTTASSSPFGKNSSTATSVSPSFSFGGAHSSTTSPVNSNSDDTKPLFTFHKAALTPKPLQIVQPPKTPAFSFGMTPSHALNWAPQPSNSPFGGSSFGGSSFGASSFGGSSFGGSSFGGSSKFDSSGFNFNSGNRSYSSKGWASSSTSLSATILPLSQDEESSEEEDEGIIEEKD